MKRVTKSKTFQKGDDFQDVCDWIIMGNRIETIDPQTETQTSEHAPYDEQCVLKHKYLITITKFVDDTVR